MIPGGAVTSQRHRPFISTIPSPWRGGVLGQQLLTKCQGQGLSGAEQRANLETSHPISRPHSLTTLYISFNFTLRTTLLSIHLIQVINNLKLCNAQCTKPRWSCLYLKSRRTHWMLLGSSFAIPDFTDNTLHRTLYMQTFDSCIY